jgi:hypothetical protein
MHTGTPEPIFQPLTNSTVSVPQFTQVAILNLFLSAERVNCPVLARVLRLSVGFPVIQG